MAGNMRGSGRPDSILGLVDTLFDTTGDNRRRKEQESARQELLDSHQSPEYRALERPGFQPRQAPLGALSGSGIGDLPGAGMGRLPMSGMDKGPRIKSDFASILSPTNKAAIDNLPAFSDRARSLLDREKLQRRAYPKRYEEKVLAEMWPEKFTGTLGENETSFIDGVKVASGSGVNREEPFKSVRMQMPGTNFYRQVLSLSDYETAVADGMVDSPTGAVPGAKSNQLELPWDMIMGPGGEIIPRSGTDSEFNRKMAEEKRERLIRADKASFDNADYSFTTLMDKAMQLHDDPDLPIISGAYDAMTLTLLPTAKKLEGRIETLKSNLALAAIQSARQGSASGATGFGALNAPELAILQTKITAIDPSADTAVLKEQLQDVFKYADTLRGKLRDGYGFKGGPDAWTINKESNETIKRIEAGELT